MARGGVVCFSRMHNIMDRLRGHLLDFRGHDYGGEGFITSLSAELTGEGFATLLSWQLRQRGEGLSPPFFLCPLSACPLLQAA